MRCCYYPRAPLRTTVIARALTSALPALQHTAPRPAISRISMFRAPPPGTMLLRHMAARSSEKKAVVKQDDYSRALELMDGGEMEAASRIWSQVLAKTPEEPEAYFYRGECSLVAQRYKDAETDYLAAIAIEPETAIYRHRLGEALVEQDRPEEALAAFSEAIAMEESAEYLHGRAQAYMMLHEREKALADLDAAIELEPDAAALQLRGQVRALLGRRKEALQDYAEAIAQDPYDAESWRARAVLRAEEDDLNGALEDIKVAVERGPDEATIHADHGRLLTRLDRPKEGRVALEHALELAPTDINVISAYAATLTALQLPSEATGQYQRAISLAPDNELLKLSLAELWCEMNEWRQAQQLIDKVLPPDGTLATSLAAQDTSFLLEKDGTTQQNQKGLTESMRATALYHRGRAHAAQKQLDKAMMDLNEALKLQPDNVAFRYERGNVAMALGQNELAQADFRAAKVDDMLALIAEREKKLQGNAKQGGKV